MRYHYRVIVIATNYNQSRFGMVGYLEAAFSCCWSLESVLFYGPRRGLQRRYGTRSVIGCRGRVPM